VSRQPKLPLGPGEVEVRISGQWPDIVRATGLLAQVGAEVLQTHGPRQNRRDPGVRVYMTVRVRQPAEAGERGGQPGPPGSGTRGELR
jgi:hypothetical protein